MGSFSSCGNHAVACSGGSRTRRPVTLLPLLALCRSAACQRARGCSFHHAIPGRQVWNGFPRKRVSHRAGLGASVQLGGAKTVEVSGHLPTSRPHERHWRPTPIREICTLSTGYHLPQPRIIARIWPFLRLTATTGPMGHITRAFPVNA